MQIFNSLTSFFSSKDDSLKNEFISESSTKTNFKDYLHGAMDEASNQKLETLVGITEIQNLQTIEAKPIELSQNPKLETNFNTELPKFNEISSKEELIYSKFIDESKQIPSEFQSLLTEENFEYEESIDEKNDSNEEDIDLEEISILEQNVEKENFIKEVEPVLLETEEILQVESSNSTPSVKLENRLKDNEEDLIVEFEKNNTNEIYSFQNDFSKNELSNSEISLNEKPISKTEIKVSNDKQEIKEEISKSDLKQTSFELLKQNFDFSKDSKVELVKEKLFIESEPKELKKDKKDKEILTKLELKEEKELNSKIESIKSDFKHAKDFSEEQNLEKSKWQISKKENISLEAKKENLFVIKENSSNQTKTEDKSIISSPIKQDLDSKILDKQKELKPEKESFQKSLNELVQKAKLNIVENGKNTAQISLYPNELGKITLNIDVTKERVEGRILVENETVKNLLLNDFLILKEDLKQSGLNLSSLSVEVKTNEEQLASFFNFEKKENLEKPEEFFTNKKTNSNDLETDINLESDNNEFFGVAKKLVDVRV